MLSVHSNPLSLQVCQRESNHFAAVAIWRGTKADPLQLALQLSMSTEEVKLQVEMISGGWSVPGTIFGQPMLFPIVPPKRVAAQVQN